MDIVVEEKAGLLTDNDLQVAINLNVAVILFGLINVPVRVLAQARSLVVRLVASHASNKIFLEARRSMVILWESGKSEHAERGNFGARKELRQAGGNSSFRNSPNCGEAHTFCALAGFDLLSGPTSGKNASTGASEDLTHGPPQK